MASFFISHSSRDNAVADRLRRWLEQEGFTSVFLDFDPETGIPAGRRWEDELYSELRKADIVIFVATGAARESKWCHAELVLARALGKKIVPLRLERGAAHPLIADTQWIDAAAHGDAAFQPLVAALGDLGVDPLDTLDWDPRIGPYPGLSPFDDRRAGVFFGRDEEIRSIRELVTRPHATELQGLVLVVGASGSGKSSLVRAGVLPRLALSGERFVVVPAFTADDAPLEKLARSLASAFRELDRDVTWEACHERLAGGDGALVELARDLLDAAGRSSDGCVVLTVDQAEQLVTQCAERDRIDFVNQLVAALQAPVPLCVLATLRTEYLAELAAGTALEGSSASTIPVSRLSPLRLAEVIASPARRAGLEFEPPELVERMAAETRAGLPSGGDPLPLLAFMLRRLYEQRSERTRITERDYELVGGVAGALKAEANRVHGQLEQQGKADAVVPALLDLVHVETDREPTARSVRRARFDGARSDVIEAFVEARLLTTEGDDPVVSVAHEALLREWPLLARAIEDASDELEARSRLERDAREWDRAERDPRYLTGGVRLEAVRRALDNHPDAEAGLDEVEREFLQANVAHEEEQHRAAQRRVRLTIGGLAVAVVLISAGAILALWQSRVAADERDVARSRELATRAMAQLAVDPAVGVRLAAQAAEAKRTPEAEGALRAALAESHSRAVLRGHTGVVMAAAFDPEGKRIVTASFDGTARVWDAATGKSLRVLRGHTRALYSPSFARESAARYSAAFDPEGQRVVTTANDHTVRVWDVATGDSLAVLPERHVLRAAFDREGKRIITAGWQNRASSWDLATATREELTAGGERHLGAVRGSEFDRDGKRVVTSENGAAYVRETATGRRLAVLRGHTAEVNSAAFGPEGDRIVTASDDGTARVWDAASGRSVAILRGHRGAVFFAAFDADGGRVVTTSGDGTARVWDVATERRLAMLRGASGFVAGVVFDRDGKRFVAVGGDRTLRVWEAASGKSLAVLLRDNVSVVHASFDREGKRIVTWGYDGTTRVWDAATGKRLAVLRGHTARVDSATFDREGKRILTASADGTARVWDAASRKSLVVLDVGGESDNARAAFDHEGKRILTTSGATVRVWEASTGKSLAVLRGHTKIVYGAAFDPEGERIVTAGIEGTVRIWDAATGQNLAVLRGQIGEPPAAAIDPGGRLVVTVGSDGARVWDVATGKSLAVLGGRESPIVSAAFAADGKRIVTVGKDDTVRIYACRPCGTPDHLLAEARKPARFEREQELFVAQLVFDNGHGVVRLYACRPCGPDDVQADGRKQASFGRVQEVLVEQLGIDEQDGTVRLYACRPCGPASDLLDSRAEIFERVQELLVELLGIDESEITEDASFSADLDVDELDLIELIIELEDQFGIRITREDENRLQTVGQAVDHVLRQQ